MMMFLPLRLCFADICGFWSVWVGPSSMSRNCKVRFEFFYLKHLGGGGGVCVSSRFFWVGFVESFSEQFAKSLFCYNMRFWSFHSLYIPCTIQWIFRALDQISKFLPRCEKLLECSYNKYILISACGKRLCLPRPPDILVILFTIYNELNTKYKNIKKKIAIFLQWSKIQWPCACRDPR